MANQSDIQNMLADLEARIGVSRNKPLLNPNLPSFGSSANVQTSDYNPTKTGSGGDSIPLWMKALTGLSSTGKLVTDTLANITSGDWSDNILTQGWKGQKEAWTDGKLGFGDLPLWGALYGIGRDGKGFEHTLDNMGITKAGSAGSKWGGLAGDLILDPLNLVTFGAGSAIKAGAKASQVAAKGLAREAGLKAGKAIDLPSLISDSVKARHADNPAINQNLVARLADKKAGAAQKVISDAGAAARKTAQNATLSIDVPFTKLSSTLLDRSQIPVLGKYLTRSDAKIGATGSAAVADALRSVGLNGDDPAHAAQIKKLLEDNYGVSSIADMTTQGMQHLQQAVGKFGSKFAANSGDAKNFLNGHSIEEIMSKEVNPNHNPKIDGNMNVGSYQEPFLDKLSRTVTPKPFEMAKGDEFMKTLDGFVQDMGGTSKLGASLSKYNKFNPRSFNSADPLANIAAGGLRDAQGKISGLTRHTNEQLAAVTKLAEGLSEAEKKAIPYYIEKAFPKNFDRTSVNESKIQEVADAMTGVLNKIGERDLSAGVIKSRLKNYFPHVMKPGAKGIDDPKIAQILGKSQASGFGKTRQGFDSLAQLEDAIATLKSGAAKATDPAEAEGMRETAARLEELFERNPIDALGHRAYESIKASSMAELYTKLEADGLIVSKTLDATNIDRGFNAETKGYHVLTKQEAGALGLPEGAKVHPDVFEGMKDVRELFTLKGMNDFVAGMNKAVSVWKSLVTSYVPAHYVNNFIGNIANNTLAGVGPKSYTDAYDILRAAKSGKMTPDQEKLMKEAYDHGVFGQGFSSEFVKSRFSTEKTGKLDAFTDAMTHNKYASTMRKVGDKIDDFSRMALFMHGYEQTGSFSHAGKMVSKYLFNYNIQSNADKAVRSVVPFWTWTKNNLPLQIQGIMQQPRYYSTYQKVREAFNADIEPKEGKEYQTQDYLHLPGTDIGLPLRSLPMNDLSRFSGNPLETARKFMGDLSPAVKDPFEVTLNKQFFNNQPIYRQDDNPLAKIAEYLGNQTGAVDKGVDVLRSKDGTDLLSNLAAIFTGKPTVYK